MFLFKPGAFVLMDVFIPPWLDSSACLGPRLVPDQIPSRACILVGPYRPVHRVLRRERCPARPGEWDTRGGWRGPRTTPILLLWVDHGPRHEKYGPGKVRPHISSTFAHSNAAAFYPTTVMQEYPRTPILHKIPSHVIEPTACRIMPC